MRGTSSATCDSTRYTKTDAVICRRARGGINTNDEETEGLPRKARNPPVLPRRT